MPVVTFPNGEKRDYQDNVSVLDIANSISNQFANIAIACKINETEIVDLNHIITSDCTIKIITINDVEDSILLMRQSTATILAMAISQLYPNSKPASLVFTNVGFNYDFDVDSPFTPEDLITIEKTMVDIINKNIPFYKSTMSISLAKEVFVELNQQYKVEILSDIDDNDKVHIYGCGDAFVDIGFHPHVPSTGKVQEAFKLMPSSGAYWKGNSSNNMLQRISCVCFSNKKDLKNYLKQHEEAEKRDHRKLATVMDLFHIQDEAVGMIFWHPNGYTLYNTIESYMRTLLNKNGYSEVKTPQVVDKVLWEKSGHWEHYHNNMFTTHSEHKEYAIKPMNCPCHIQIFNKGIKSYRDLPFRMAEFGSCHRNEPSGSLHGLMRVRGFTQDDAHIFCTEEQMQEETEKFIKLTLDVYKTFGFNDVELKLSTRPVERIGDEKLWDKAELALTQALDKVGKNWELQEGEGAFYGPKIEFSLRDCLGRVWQCGTLQLDFVLPERLDSAYIAEDGSKKVPVMLHRAILGSFERFIGILLEHYSGNLPTWLSPVQVVVLNIADKHAEYATSVTEQLKANNLRSVSDLSNEKIGFKIRKHTISKVPFMIIVGDKELESGVVSLRNRSGKDYGSMSIEEAISKIHIGD